MIIKVHDLNFNVRLEFLGTLDEFFSYFEYIKDNIQDFAIDDDDGGLIIAKRCLIDIQKKYNTVSVTHTWDDIGKDMKLKPFPYQKQVIYYALNNQKCLLVLPPGSGKTYYIL